MPGDDIGPEITAASLIALEAANRKHRLDLQFQTVDVGMASYRKHGDTLTPAALEAAAAADGVILGPCGMSAYPPREKGGTNVPGSVRTHLDLFANLRPATCFPMLVDASPLKRSVVEGTDLMVIRELTGGLYFGEPRGREELPGGGTRAVNSMVYTAAEIERVARAAFDVAMKRKKRLTSVDKANVLVVSQLWR